MCTPYQKKSKLNTKGEKQFKPIHSKTINFYFLCNFLGLVIAFKINNPQPNPYLPFLFQMHI